MRSRSLFGAAHKLATLPVRPLGAGARSISEFMTDSEPVVSKLGDMAVDAGSDLIGKGVASMVGGASDALAAAAPAVAAGGASVGGSIGSLLDPFTFGAGTPVGAAIGGAVAPAISSTMAAGGKALAAAEPLIQKAAVPAIKGLGRMAYHGVRDTLGGGATLLGSDDESPGLTQGRRDMAAAQNPLRISDFVQSTAPGVGTPDPIAMRNGAQGMNLPTTSERGKELVAGLRSFKPGAQLNAGPTTPRPDVGPPMPTPEQFAKANDPRRTKPSVSQMLAQPVPQFTVKTQQVLDAENARQPVPDPGEYAQEQMFRKMAGRSGRVMR